MSRTFENVSENDMIRALGSGVGVWVTELVGSDNVLAVIREEWHEGREYCNELLADLAAGTLDLYTARHRARLIVAAP